MPIAIIILAVLVGLGVGTALYIAIAPAKATTDDRVRAIDDYVSVARDPNRGVRSAGTPASVTAQLVGLGERVMATRESTSRTMDLLQRADLPWRSGEWAVLRVISLVLGLVVGYALLHGGLLTLLGLLLGGAVGLFAPDLVLKFLAKRRSRKFDAQMPDILMLIASSLSTGFSLMQALDACSTDVAQPAAKEFSRVMAETRIGADVEDALDRLADRMGSANMAWIAMAIRIQRSVGGNLAETLRNTAATLRERESLLRHVKALSAEGKLSAYILVLLPVGLFLYEAQVNRPYIELLWTTIYGWGMLIFSAISLAIGIVWMNAVVKVKV